MESVFRKSYWIFLIAILMSITVDAQEELTLRECQEIVMHNFPLAKGKEIIQTQGGLNKENVEADYLPRVFANGKISYQSDVTGISLPNVQTPTAPKDQYHMNMDVEQIIYQGGRKNTRMKLEDLSVDIEQKNLDVQLYALRTRVNSAFYSILLLRKSEKIIAEKRQTITARLKDVNKAVESGMMPKADAMVLEAEILLLEQQSTELKSSERRAFVVLAELMGRNIDFDIAEESINVNGIAFTNELRKLRPEYDLYASQKEMLDEQINLVKKDRLPTFSGFAQVGVGKPGYNQLKDQHDSYYMLGGKFSWKIFDWKATKRKQRILDLQKDLVTTQEDSFIRNQKVELGSEGSNIQKYKDLLLKDDEIVRLKIEITKSASSRLENGIITSSDYLEELNKEVQSRLNREYHRIQLNQAIQEYKRILGDY
ncbi:TolC family protein [Puteibacter caeruleilacunae]|nr:TolC family protein [Puteibacter caeruleilacunae]